MQKFTAAGAFISAFGSCGSAAGQFSGPRGLAVNSSGTLYVADTANNRIEEWVPSPLGGQRLRLESAGDVKPVDLVRVVWGEYDRRQHRSASGEHQTCESCST